MVHANGSGGNISTILFSSLGLGKAEWLKDIRNGSCFLLGCSRGRYRQKGM